MTKNPNDEVNRGVYEIPTASLSPATVCVERNVTRARRAHLSSFRLEIDFSFFGFVFCASSKWWIYTWRDDDDPCAHTSPTNLSNSSQTTALVSSHKWSECERRTRVHCISRRVQFSFQWIFLSTHNMYSSSSSFDYYWERRRRKVNEPLFSVSHFAERSIAWIVCRRRRCRHRRRRRRFLLLLLFLRICSGWMVLSFTCVYTRSGYVNISVEACRARIWSEALRQHHHYTTYALRSTSSQCKSEYHACVVQTEVDSISHSKRFGTFVDDIRFGFLVLKFLSIAKTKTNNRRRKRKKTTEEKPIDHFYSAQYFSMFLFN